jgi:hypothetical protein
MWSPAVTYSGELEYYGKDDGISQKTVTNISALSSGSRTITTSMTAHGYEVGDVVVIAGVASTPAGLLNETVFVRSVPSFNTFTYQTSQSATYNSGGSLKHTASLRGVRVTDYGSAEAAGGMYNGDIICGYPRYGEILITAPKTDDSVYPDSSAVALTSAKMFGTKPVENPTVEINGKLRFPYSGDASLTGNTHAIQIGPAESINLVIDNNEIMGRNNGGTGNLILNANGGNVSVNGSIVKGVVSGSGTTTAGGTGTFTHGLGGGVSPIVVCTVKAGAATTAEYSIYVTSANTSQFSVRSLSGAVATSVNFNWVAVAP